MLKFGFELEFFIVDTLTGQPTLVPPDLPKDECGWLVEVRSEPHEHPLKAIHLLHAETQLVVERAERRGFQLKRQPRMEIPRALKVDAARQNGKGLLRFRNLYGHKTHRNSPKEATASLHVSITNAQRYSYRDKDNRELSFTYPGFIDHAHLITTCDREFTKEIKESKRNPGFYEIKHDGRIEYRSLPNDVDLEKVARVLTQLVESGFLKQQ